MALNGGREVTFDVTLVELVIILLPRAQGKLFRGRLSHQTHSGEINIGGGSRHLLYNMVPVDTSKILCT